MSTRQAPHRPRPQPKRVPVSPRWFRSTYSSAVSRSVRTSSRWPFTSTVSRMGSVSGISLAAKVVASRTAQSAEGPGIQYSGRDRRLVSRRLNHEPAGRLAPGHRGRGSGSADVAAVYRQLHVDVAPGGIGIWAYLMSGGNDPRRL